MTSLAKLVGKVCCAKGVKARKSYSVLSRLMSLKMFLHLPHGSGTVLIESAVIRPDVCVLMLSVVGR